MQPLKSKTKLALAAIAVTAMSQGVQAAVEPLSVGFTTVPDITLTQVQAMDFGAGMSLSDSVTCTMAVAADQSVAADWVGDVTARAASTGADTAGATVGDLTGAGCPASAAANEKGTIGLYEISGIAGGSVKVTVNAITTGTSFNYAPAGCVVLYNDAGDGDSCVDVSSGNAIPTILATAGDTVGNTAGSGTPQPGKSLIILGGAITTAKTHTAGELMSEDFTIDVTY